MAIGTNLSKNSHYNFELYNMQGRVGLTQSVSDKQSISIEQLKNGVYYYKLIDEKGAIRNGKLLKE